METGVQCAITSGKLMMLTWPVNSLVIPNQVSSEHINNALDV